MSGAAGGSKSMSNFGGSGKFQQNIDPTQLKYLDSLWKGAGDLYGGVGKNLTKMTPSVSRKLNLATDRALFNNSNEAKGGEYRKMNLAKNLSNTLNESLRNPSMASEIQAKVMGGAGNNYADAMKASLMADANRVKDNMLATTDARAADAGMGGSSRHGIVQSKGLYDINSNLQKNLTEVGYNTFDKDLERKLDIAKKADEGTLARQGMLKDMLGEMTGKQTAAVDRTGQIQNSVMGNFAPYMVPWQNMSNYSQTLGGPVVLGSGSSRNSGNSMGGGKGASGGIK